MRRRLAASSLASCSVRKRVVVRVAASGVLHPSPLLLSPFSLLVPVPFYPCQRRSLAGGVWRFRATREACSGDSFSHLLCGQQLLGQGVITKDMLIYRKLDQLEIISPSVIMSSMVAVWELLLLVLANHLLKATGNWPCMCSTMAFDMSYCLSWRVAVEANNVRPWRTVPAQCIRYVEDYMLGGQYCRDLDTVVEQILIYLNGIVAADDGMDAWILDVDDTCLSNLRYYRDKHFGGEPFDSMAFKNWALKGVCPAIPAMLQLYRMLIDRGFKVFLVTGRDEEAFSSMTSQNLHAQGFIGYERLIMRNPLHRGLGAVVFKSTIREQLMAEGYRIRGNVGDQWSDLTGDCAGDRIFKVPNPMYFVP